MIEPIMYLAIGFLISMLFGLMIVPLVHNRAAESELLAAGRAGGLRAMREDGERLVAAGVTSRAELLRVTRD